MNVAIIRFPGSNCDQDALHALKDDLGLDASYVWHEQEDLDGFHAAFVPGGFSYGDYLRCGAIAARANVMKAVRKMADQGKPVIGVCNGFQVLCEAGLLPGALLLNAEQKFICKDVYLKAENTQSLWTRGIAEVLRIPIAHGEGRYVAEESVLKELEDRGRVAFRYVDPQGQLAGEWNANGSSNAIAGILNPSGNVLGMMPHPERATKAILGNTDGLQILRALTLVNA